MLDYVWLHNVHISFATCCRALITFLCSAWSCQFFVRCVESGLMSLKTFLSHGSLVHCERCFAARNSLTSLAYLTAALVDVVIISAVGGGANAVQNTAP